MTAIKLPYFAPTSELPQPLPTDQEIHDATDEYMKNGGRRLVRIGPYMVKYGPGVNIIEGENMLSVSRNTTVPVPRVYAIYTTAVMSIYTKAETLSSYIVMEFLEGKTLSLEWESINEKQKEDLSGQLRGYMSQIRSIPSPGYYGSIGRRGLLDGM